MIKHYRIKCYPILVGLIWMVLFFFILAFSAFWWGRLSRISNEADLLDLLMRSDFFSLLMRSTYSAFWWGRTFSAFWWSWLTWSSNELSLFGLLDLLCLLNFFDLFNYFGFLMTCRPALRKEKNMTDESLWASHHESFELWESFPLRVYIFWGLLFLFI